MFQSVTVTGSQTTSSQCQFFPGTSPVSDRDNGEVWTAFLSRTMQWNAACGRGTIPEAFI